MTPWWGPLLLAGATVIAAIVAGSFAVRNAPKTPHENLKALLELGEKVPKGQSDRHATIQRAIDAELYRLRVAVEIGQRNMLRRLWFRIVRFVGGGQGIETLDYDIQKQVRDIDFVRTFEEALYPGEHLFPSADLFPSGGPVSDERPKP